MPENALDSLVGRTVSLSDHADAHRMVAYRRLFGLQDGELLLGVHWLLFTALPEETRHDGHAATMAPFPTLPYPRRMWAGGEIQWLMPIGTDEQLDRQTVVTRADAKQGGAGNFLLTSLEHTIAAADGHRVIERQDIVFLPAATRPGSAPAKPAAFEPEWSVDLAFDTVALFRYSALTLNGHRIHYDAPYARDEEHYSGLVVQGPLLATTLLHAGARRRGGSDPSRFAYRAVAPSFADERLRAIGRAVGATEELAIVGPDDGLRMTGLLTYAVHG